MLGSTPGRSLMPRLTNLRKSEHILGGGMLPNGGQAENIVLKPGVTVELSDAEFKRHDSIPLRAMIAAGDLVLGETPAPKAPPAPTSNAPARNADAEAEAAEILTNIKKSRR